MTITTNTSTPMLLRTTRRYLKKSTTKLALNSKSFTTPGIRKEPCSLQSTSPNFSGRHLDDANLLRRASHTAAVKLVSHSSSSNSNSSNSQFEYDNYNQLENFESDITEKSTSLQNQQRVADIEAFVLRIVEETGENQEFRKFINRGELRQAYVYYLTLLQNFAPLSEVVTSDFIDAINQGFPSNYTQSGQEFKNLLLTLNSQLFKYRLEFAKLELITTGSELNTIRRFNSLMTKFFTLLNNKKSAEFSLIQLSLVPLLPKFTKVSSMVKTLTKLENLNKSGEGPDFNFYLGLMPEIIESSFGKSLVIKAFVSRGKFNDLEDFIQTDGQNTSTQLNKINLNQLLWGYVQLGDNVRVKHILSMFYKSKVPLTNYSHSSLIIHWSKLGLLHRCLKLIQQNLKKTDEMPNEVILTNLVNAFALEKDLKAASYYYQKCLEFGYSNNVKLHTIMLNLYIELGEVNLAKELIKQLITNFEMDPVLVGVITKWLAISNLGEYNSIATQPYDFLINQWAQFRNLPTIELTGILSSYLKYHSNQLPIPNLLGLIDEFVLLKPEPTFCIDVFNQTLKLVLKTSSSQSEENYYLKTLSNWLIKHNIEPNIVTHHIMLTNYLKNNRLTEATNLFCYYFPNLKQFPFTAIDPEVYKSNLELNPSNLTLGRKKLDIGLINLFMDLCLKLNKPRLVPILLLTAVRYQLEASKLTYEFVLKACLLANDSKTLHWCLLNESNIEYLPSLTNGYIQLISRTLYSNNNLNSISQPIHNQKFLNQISKIFENTLKFLQTKKALPQRSTVNFMITVLNQFEDPTQSDAKIHTLLELVPKSYTKGGEELVRFNEEIKGFLDVKKGVENYLS